MNDADVGKYTADWNKNEKINYNNELRFSLSPQSS